MWNSYSKAKKYKTFSQQKGKFEINKNQSKDYRFFLLGEKYYRKKTKDRYIYSEEYEKISNIIKELKEDKKIEVRWYRYKAGRNSLEQPIVATTEYFLRDIKKMIRDCISSQPIEDYGIRRVYLIKRYDNGKLLFGKIPKKIIHQGIFSLTRDQQEKEVVVIPYKDINLSQIDRFLKKINELFPFLHFTEYEKTLSDKRYNIILYYEKLPPITDLNELLDIIKGEERPILIISSSNIDKKSYAKMKVHSIKEYNEFYIPSKISRLQFIDKTSLIGHSEEILVNLTLQLLYKMDFIPFLPQVGEKYRFKFIFCAIGFARPDDNNISKMTAVAMPSQIEIPYGYLLTSENYRPISSGSYELLDTQEWENVFRQLLEYLEQFELSKNGLREDQYNLALIRKRPLTVEEYDYMIESKSFNKVLNIFKNIYFISITNKKVNIWNKKARRTQVAFGSGVIGVRYSRIKDLIILNVRKLGSNEIKIPNKQELIEVFKAYEWIRTYRPDNITILPDMVSYPFLLRIAEKYSRYFSLM